MNSAPIGVFDSGLGGLTVAAEILERLPGESILYFADTAHVPYGERPLDEIQGFALDITGFLQSQGAKMVVMACNMSSAVALDAAVLAYPDIPVIGVIEPGARAASRCAGDRPIGALATTGTVASHAYSNVIGRIAPSIAVYEQACPDFVPIVESGRCESPEAYAAAGEYVGALLEHAVGAIILGCTHYPFLSKAISAAAGPGVSLIDPAEETVNEIRNILVERDIQATAGSRPAHRFISSGDPAAFAELGSRLMGRRIERAERAVWGVDLGRVYA